MADQVSMPAPPPESASSLLQVAQQCFSAVEKLQEHPNMHMLIPTGILAAHGVEATLKCHLMQHRAAPSQVRSFGHDLLKAWAAAVAAGPPIEGDAPAWLVSLNWGHAKLTYRYPPHQHGIGVPRLEDFMPWWADVLRALQRVSWSP